MTKTGRFFIALGIVAMILCGCMRNSTPSDSVEKTWQPAAIKPELPEKLTKNDVGIPILNVYDAANGQVERVDLETYVTGVVAGEMKNDWPIEALKAQAILARTFVLRFCDTKESSYEGADISTDVSEAQAYAPENINEQVRTAVEQTKGEVMSYNGEYPNAWFFAHAGGKTELPSVALDWSGEDPEYLSVMDSPDSDDAPDDVEDWEATFTLDEVKKACLASGLTIESVEKIEIGERGASGRAKTFQINGNAVSAPSFRIHIGANKLKSTLIDEIEIEDGRVSFSGEGFGHGVGMSQWGAYELANRGKTAEEIINYYFKDIDIVKMW